MNAIAIANVPYISMVLYFYGLKLQFHLNNLYLDLHNVG